MRFVNFVLSILSAALLVGAAQAADLPVKAPPVRAVAAPTWTGCYIGGNIGYGWAPTKWSDANGEFGSHTADGIVGGGQLGCDYQVGTWVFGIRGLVDAASLTGHSTNFTLDPPIDSTHVTMVATLTGRIGYAFDPTTLLYVNGGVAWVRETLTECCETPPPPPPPPPVTNGLDGFAKVTRTGWTIGAGLEHKFFAHLSGFVEYNYIGLGNHSVGFAPLNFASVPFVYRIDQNVQQVLLGVNYRF